jgi:hypothetical protein
MRVLRSRLAVFALAVVACQSATLLTAPLSLCGASRAETASSGVDVDCPCGDETGTCPMHHRSAKRDHPVPAAPAKGQAYCSGCADNDDAALLVMTGLGAPAVTSFDLVAPQAVIAFVAIPPTRLVPVDTPPSAPPPKA